MLSTILSSFIPVAYADAPEDKSEDKPSADSANESNEGSKEESEEEEAKDNAEEEEEDEPEDILPTLRDECANSTPCVGFKKHFEHCQEKVEAGDGFKGEDCVEEIMMHCADNCLAPKLFSKLG